MVDYRNHLIVSGAPRSGTTALTKLLNTHPDVFVTNELGFYEDWFNVGKWKNFIHTREWISFVENAEIFERHKADVYCFRDYIISHHLSGSKIYDWIEVYHNPKVIGDKCPIAYVNRAPQLAHDFHNAKFLFVVRDGRDVISSQLRAYNKYPPGSPEHASHWMSPSIEQAQTLWIQVNSVLISVLNCINSNRVMLFRYEDAVFDIDGFCSQLSDFLELTVRPVEGVFVPTSVGSWRKEHPDMMGRLNATFRSMLETFGYI